MRTLIATVQLQVAGPSLTRSVLIGNGAPEWHRLLGCLGMHALLEEVEGEEVYSLRISPSIIDSEDGALGGVHFHSITIDVGVRVCVPALPGVTAIRAEGTTIVIGGNGLIHCIPAGHAIRVRFAVGSDPSVIWKRYRWRNDVRIAPQVSLPLPRAFSGMSWGWGSPGEGFGFQGHHATPLGERYGHLDQGAPGMSFIDFMPGYDGDCEIALRRCDAMMNAWPWEARNRDGTLVESEFEDLDGWWHWWREGFQVGRFLDKSAPQTKPLWWTTGTCEYEEYAAGLVTYRDSQAQNLEHLRRITGPLECAVEQWGDRLAALDLELVARTMRAAFRARIDGWMGLARARRGLGHHELGGRGLSWLADLLVMHPLTRGDGLALARATAAMQMPNGACNRKPGPWNSSPDPYTPGTGINNALPLTTEATQTMECAIMAYTLSRAGAIDQARQFVDRMLVTSTSWWGVGPLRGLATDRCVRDRAGYVPKFLGTTDSTGRPLRRSSAWTDGTDYAQYVMLGLGLALSRDKRPFLDALQTTYTPHTGRALGSPANAIAALAADEIVKEQTSILVSALESLP